MKVLQRSGFVFLVPLIFCCTALGIESGGDLVIQPMGPGDLATSLHGTARGMRTLFEHEDGFGPYSGISYDDLSCKNCHVQPGDCAICHGDFTSQKEFEIATCEACHSRQSKEAALGVRGVHMSDIGMNCASCHSSDEVHGDGNVYASMFEPGVFDVACTNCHTSISSSYSHDEHTSTLTCATCHSATVITCYNCHFESMVQEDVKRAMKAFADFVLLVNDPRVNKVNTGSYQSVYYQGKTFAVFSPFFGHSIKAEGRICEDCHNNATMKMLKNTGEIELTKWEGDTVSHLKGVIPLVDGKMIMQFVDYDATTQQWSPAEIGPEQVQHGYCTPLSEAQLQKLMDGLDSFVKPWAQY